MDQVVPSVHDVGVAISTLLFSSPMADAVTWTSWMVSLMKVQYCTSMLLVFTVLVYFTCCMCMCSVPPEYFCHLDHRGMRADLDRRPELYYGSVEFVATSEYCKVV